MRKDRQGKEQTLQKHECTEKRNKLEREQDESNNNAGRKEHQKEAKEGGEQK